SAAGDRQADAELALTRAYLGFASHIASGVIDNPQRLGLGARSGKRASATVLLEGMARADDPAGSLAALPPDAKAYDALKAALESYRQIASLGGWPAVSPGPALKSGMHGRRVAEVKRRLLVTGELGATGRLEVFDAALAEAVKTFQRRHGLADDGSV